MTKSWATRSWPWISAAVLLLVIAVMIVASGGGPSTPPDDHRASSEDEAADDSPNTTALEEVKEDKQPVEDVLYGAGLQFAYQAYGARFTCNAVPEATLAIENLSSLTVDAAALVNVADIPEIGGIYQSGTEDGVAIGYLALRTPEGMLLVKEDAGTLTAVDEYTSATTGLNLDTGFVNPAMFTASVCAGAFGADPALVEQQAIAAIGPVAEHLRDGEATEISVGSHLELAWVYCNAPAEAKPAPGRLEAYYESEICPRMPGWEAR